ncbi:MAG TPA: glycosyltransferase family 9 protein [Gemmatimonadaceae bacterium]|nr:glycosyltransferase family 9 protein [Gemmatimonadaceae bacterium]
MARTWPVTRKKVIAFSAFDAVARPLASLFPRAKANGNGSVRKILVVELWHMGDVVLVTPFLSKLRQLFPDARITLIAKPHAEELLRFSGLVDEVIPFDFPWTATEEKYRFSRYDRKALTGLLKRLRAERFDLTFDCRMDLRSNLLTRATRAPRRVGYDFGGGGFLLTDSLPPPPLDQHKVDDWLALLGPVLPDWRQNTDDASLPRLVVTDEECEEARKFLGLHDLGDDDMIVGIHPGGSHDGKRWPIENFEEAARSLAAKRNVNVLIFVDPEGTGANMQLGPTATFVRTSIREMMALMTRCATVICNDSGPMHIAAALGVPVVAMFTTGNPDWYGPQGAGHSVVGTGAPWGEVNDTITVSEVVEAAERNLHKLAGSRSAGGHR